MAPALVAIDGLLLGIDERILLSAFANTPERVHRDDLVAVEDIFTDAIGAPPVEFARTKSLDDERFGEGSSIETIVDRRQCAGAHDLSRMLSQDFFDPGTDLRQIEDQFPVNDLQDADKVLRALAGEAVQLARKSEAVAIELRITIIFEFVDPRLPVQVHITGSLGILVKRTFERLTDAEELVAEVVFENSQSLLGSL